MKKYYVSAPVIAFTGKEIEAQNKEDARNKFEEWLDENGPSLCHQCSRSMDTDGELNWDELNIEETN